MITRSTVQSETKQLPSKEDESDLKHGLPSSESGLMPPTLDLRCTGIVRDVLHSSWAGVLFLTSSTVSSPPTSSPAFTEPPSEKPRQPKVLLRCISAGQFEPQRLQQRKSEKSQANGDHIRLIVTPEIQVNAETPSETEFTPKRSRQRSHSSAGREQHLEEPPIPRATSDISIGSQGSVEIKSSKSDFSGFGANVLSSFGIPSPQKFTNMLASPSNANRANPLAFIAKGVQNLGANFDPRKKLDTKREQPKFKNDHDTIVCSNTRIIHL